MQSAMARYGQRAIPLDGEPSFSETVGEIGRVLVLLLGLAVAAGGIGS